MSGFSAEWLELREPYDAVARAPQLADVVARTAATRFVVDLGSGTGANLRYLAPLIGAEQQWLLVDDDRAVLAALPRALAAWAAATDARCTVGSDECTITGAAFRCAVRWQRLDIARGLEALPLAAGTLVTSSALLDLVSAEWLHALAARCCSAGVDVLFALTYDGRIDARPADEEDEVVRELVNEHQHRNKGFGPALGPDAAQAAVRTFALFGYEVRTAASDWQIAASAAAMQLALIDGWHAAAAAVAPKRAAALARWRHRRRSYVERGVSTLRVGHVDLAARAG